MAESIILLNRLPFKHRNGTPEKTEMPSTKSIVLLIEAKARNRTEDLLITSELLYL